MSFGDQPAPLTGIDENTWTVGKPMHLACQSFFDIERPLKEISD